MTTMLRRITAIRPALLLRSVSTTPVALGSQVPGIYPHHLLCHPRVSLLAPLARRCYSGPLTPVTYEQVCEDTLDSLSEQFEELLESSTQFPDSDVTLGDGVLTVNLGPKYGTYVINRQRPNLQIWLSSPTSGPKRYDFINGHWVYKHDGVSLHELLEKEFSQIYGTKVDLSKCDYANAE